MWRKEKPCVVQVAMQIALATLRNSMEFPQKIKNRTII